MQMMTSFSEKKDQLQHSLYHANVKNAEQATQILGKNIDPNKANFIFWEAPEDIGTDKIRISYLRNKMPDNLKDQALELETVTLVTDLREWIDEKNNNALDHMAEYLYKRLKFGFISDNDWTLTRYHTHYEESKLPKKKNGKVDHQANIRFLEQIDVLNALYKKPNVILAFATGHQDPQYIEGGLEAMKELGLDRNIGQYYKNYVGKGAYANELYKKLIKKPLQNNDRLFNNPSKEILDFIDFYVMNDAEDENITLSNKNFKVIQVNDKDNNHLMNANNIFKLQQNIQKRPLPAMKLEERTQELGRKEDPISTYGMAKKRLFANTQISQTIVSESSEKKLENDIKKVLKETDRKAMGTAEKENIQNQSETKKTEYEYEEQTSSAFSMTTGNKS